MSLLAWVVLLLGHTTASVALTPCATAKRISGPPAARPAPGGRRSAASVVVWGDQKEGKGGWGLGDVFDLLEDKAGYEGFTEADLKVEGGVRDEKAATELSDKMKAREIDDAAKGGAGLPTCASCTDRTTLTDFAASHPQRSGALNCYYHLQRSFLWFRVVRWWASVPSSRCVRRSGLVSRHLAC